MDLQGNNLKSSMKDNLPFGAPSSQGFLQDFHNTNHFHHVNGSSSTPALGVQTTNIDPFNNLTCGCSQGDLDVYECKPFVENDGSGHAYVMDNFQYEGCSLNLPNSPFNPVETKPLNFVAPDEVSSISPANYNKRVGLDKDNSSSPTTRRAFKVRKKSNMVKGQWTAEEDRLLIQLVEQYGVRKWAHIAQALPGRIGKQCRERWHNHLRPDIKKDIWSDEEDKILIQAHAEMGNKWAEIAKRLPGRTENSIKNHWNATKRRQYSRRKCRSKYPRNSLLQEYIKSLNLDQNPPIYFRKGSSAKAMTNSNTSTSKAAAAPPHSNDRLVPKYDFNEVPDLCFDDDLFIHEGCIIDSLLDDVPCAPTMDEKDFDGKMQHIVNLDEQKKMPQEMMAPTVGVEVKKEMDLEEMMSQVNENIDA